MELRHLLPHLHYFWTVAKNKSFSKAAAELHVTTSAISYQIRALEDKLNVRLLKRDSGQRTELTEAGQEIAKQCQKIFGQMGVMFDEVITQEKSNELVITAPVSFGTHLLTSAAQYINEKLVNADLKLILTDTVLDVYEDNIDVAIRNVQPSGNLLGEELMKVKHHAVASEDYLQNSAPLSEIYDLQNHQLIYFDKKDSDWRRVQKMFPRVILPTGKHITYISSNISILEGVRNGVGIALLPDYLLDANDLKRKEISLILEDYFNDRNIGLMDTLYIGYSKINLKSVLIRDFIYYLKKFLKTQGYQVSEESMVA